MLIQHSLIKATEKKEEMSLTNCLCHVLEGSAWDLLDIHAESWHCRSSVKLAEKLSCFSEPSDC